MNSAHRSFQLALIAVTALALVASFVQPLYPEDQPLHHVATVIVLVILVIVARRQALSNLSMASIVVFLWLHILGARYVYSMVPYDEWARGILGSSLSERFGWERNHYDRLVHFAFGVLATAPQTEVLRRRFGVTALAAHLASFVLVVCNGALYEIFEWGLAETMAPDVADRYNGQQGDFWDAQKDMALNAAGAILASLTLSLFRWPRKSAGTRERPVLDEFTNRTLARWG